ncbi:uncharacterized protein M6B38_249570 [Iris pallida]|uniref:Uncharacterized protein n=1 Tax=Iris pallida TaxID=29817 RepID=A0AAX6IKP7_IRIPA|nr:uncharacterized protein M6B38_249570 [Iris pallida]
MSVQLKSYRAALGGFSEEMALDHISQVPPVFWWSLHGSHCPESQKVAIRILNQVCSCNLRHKLRTCVSEQLHAKAQNSIEQQRFTNMEFVRNNLCLWQPPSNRGRRDDVSLVDFSALNDWIVEDM